MFNKLKYAMNFTRLILVVFLFIAMAVNSYAGNYGMAIIYLLLIVVFELQEINSKIKSGD
jgi:hypothetical protein